MHIKNQKDISGENTLVLFGTPRMYYNTSQSCRIYVDIRAVYNAQDGTGDTKVFIKDMSPSQKDKIAAYARKLVKEKVAGKYKIIPIPSIKDGGRYAIQKKDVEVMQSDFNTHALFYVKKI